MSFSVKRPRGTDGVSDAKDIKITPSGNITSTDIEGALKELDQRTAATGAKLYKQSTAPSDTAGLWISD